MSKDMRSYLKDLGDLVLEINKEACPHTQMGELSGQSTRPILFNNVKGYPGWKVFDVLLHDRNTQAIALGTTPEKVVPYLSKLMEKDPVPCKKVTDGPVKENILLDEDADLTKLPILIHSERDNGPYIGSGLNVTKDPETGIQNFACYRMQIKGPRKTGLLIAPRHGWFNYEKWMKKNEPMPMAVAIGVHPVLEIANNYCTSYPQDEMEIAGSMLGEPVEMIKCETIDMEVPANAEIVIEGVVHPTEREEEGTFGEFQGYYGQGDGENPVFRVTAITMRNNPIYRHIQANCSDHHALVGLPMEGRLYKELKDVEGFIDLNDVHVPSCGGMFLNVIQLTPHYEGQVIDVLMGALSSSYLHPKVSIAVDDDIDIYNPGDVLWAVATRVNPKDDIIVIPGARNHPIDPSIPEILPPGGRWQKAGSKVGINACKPTTSFEEQRKTFGRVRPTGFGRVNLEDFIG